MHAIKSKSLILRFILLFFLFTPFLFSKPDSLFVNEDYFIVDSISISGNEITEPYIILRELTFVPGDAITENTLSYNRERIFSLGLFSKVDIHSEFIGNKSIVFISVLESWYIYPIPFIRSEGKSSNKYTYGIRLTLKNFRGLNEDLKAITGFGYDPFVAVLYDNPAIDYKNNLGFSFSLVYVKANNKSSLAKTIYGDDFKNKFYSVGTSMYKRLNQFNIVIGQLGYDYIETPKNIFIGSSASDNYIDRTLSLGIAYLYDTRDLKQFAVNGIVASIQLKHKGFGINKINYNLLRIDYREYRNLIEDLTAKWRIALRHTFGRRIPFYDYSYLGYDEYIRGHSNDVREGHNFLISSLEFSYPIIKEFNFSVKLPLLPERLTSTRIGIFITAFADAGNAFNNNQGIVLNNFYAGYGIGITFLFLPYNAIRFEYAINEKRRGEFLIGTGFAF